MRFDPFESRLCRDVRNNLGHAFVMAVQTKDREIFRQAADQYQTHLQPAPVHDYIRGRETCLKIILEETGAFSICPEEKISMLLWKLGLFFEFHEWMEIKWKSASGRTKKAFQGLILLSVTYEQLLYRRKGPALKTAAKAARLINDYRDALPKGFDADVLVQTLSGLDPVPPKFSFPA